MKTLKKVFSNVEKWLQERSFVTSSTQKFFASVTTITADLRDINDTMQSVDLIA